MKSSSLTRQAGFTLIELLVVIGIIAVLAGLSIPTASIILEKAKETQAHAGIEGLVIAITNFHTEYGRLPNPIGGSGPPVDAKLDTDSGNEMVKLLIGKNLTFNPRGTVLYAPPMAKGDANGLISSAGGLYEVVDPWSTPTAHQYYHIVLDYSEDHKIDNPVKSAASMFDPAFVAAQPADLTADVVVYSDGNPRKSSSVRKPITSW